MPTTSMNSVKKGIVHLQTECQLPLNRRQNIFAIKFQLGGISISAINLKGAKFSVFSDTARRFRLLHAGPLLRSLYQAEKVHL